MPLGIAYKRRVYEFVKDLGRVSKAYHTLSRIVKILFSIRPDICINILRDFIQFGCLTPARRDGNIFVEIFTYIMIVSPM